jgi:hypothetical protein
MELERGACTTHPPRAFDVNGSGVRPVEDPVAAAANPPAKVEILAVQKEAFVHLSSRCEQGIPPYQQKGGCAAVHLVFSAGVEIGEVVATEETTVWEERLQAEMSGETGHQRRVGTAASRIELSSGTDDLAGNGA